MASVGDGDGSSKPIFFKNFYSAMSLAGIQGRHPNGLSQDELVISSSVPCLHPFLHLLCIFKMPFHTALVLPLLRHCYFLPRQISSMTTVERYITPSVQQDKLKQRQSWITSVWLMGLLFPHAHMHMRQQAKCVQEIDINDL